MPQVVHVVGVYALPAPLEVTPDCFGAHFQTTVGSLPVQLTLPRIEWRDDEPEVVAPPMDPGVHERLASVINDTERPLGDWHYWGSVGGYEPGARHVLHAHVAAILLEYPRAPADLTYSDYPPGRGHPRGATITELFRSIDSWFDQLRTWVETAVDQDADPFHSPLAPIVHGSGLHVLTVQGSTVSLPASASTISVNFSPYEPLSLPLLRQLLQHVTAGRTPSDAQLLLRDSRADLRRSRYRRAVIDAGSATELTLADFNRRVTHINTPARGATLGWYTHQPAIKAGASLPPNIDSNLVDIRNGAIHQNRIPTREEAVAAVAVAKQVVDRLDPLPL